MTVSFPAANNVVVTGQNNDGTQHTVTSDTAGLFDSGYVNPGQTFSLAFPVAGTYHFHCAIHTYMTGTITVTP